MDQTALRLDIVGDFLARCTICPLHSQQLPEWAAETDPDPEAFARRLSFGGVSPLLCPDFGTAASCPAPVIETIEGEVRGRV